MKKVFSVIVTFLLLIVFLTGCVKTKVEPVEITFIHGWGSTDADHVAMRQIYQDFEKENPDIHINMLSMPTNEEMLRKVEDMIAAGNIPDVIFTASEGTNTIFKFMKENNMLVDIMEYTEEDKEFADSISPITIETWSDENHLYTASDVLILSGGYWYNKEIFKEVGIEKIPASWDEFDAMLTSIDDWVQENENGAASIRPSTDAYLYMADNILMENSGEFEITEEGLGKAFDTLETVHSHVGISSSYSYRDEAAMFNAGKLGIFINGVWGASMINDDIDVGYALLPSGSDAKVSCQSAGLGYLLGDTGNREKKDASIRFLKYMLSEPIQKRILLETQQMPSNPNIDVSQYSEQLARFSEAVECIQSADYRLEIPKKLWSENELEIIEKEFPKFLNGEKTKEDLINAIK